MTETRSLSPRNSPLHSEHVQAEASFTDFGGWNMPLKYSSEVTEHHAVRDAAGLFDLSHMGEIRVVGADAAVFLNTALVSNFAKLEPGAAKYSLIVTDDGGIIDDLIGYCMDTTDYLIVPNASNTEAVYEAMLQRSQGFDVEVWNETEHLALIAVQGPRAAQVISAVVRVTDVDAVTALPYYAHTTLTIGGEEILAARTGYTGEDGFELYLPVEKAGALWRALLEAGSDFGLRPCGLAARDSLRLEAGMPLYGHELSTEVLPQEAGLVVIAFTKTEDFTGRAALERARAEGVGRSSGRRLVGLVNPSKRAARQGYPVFSDAGERIGEVTSGAPSPTLGQAIALAYVDVAYAEPETELSVDIRGKQASFTVVKLPFYRR